MAGPMRAAPSLIAGSAPRSTGAAQITTQPTSSPYLGGTPRTTPARPTSPVELAVAQKMGATPRLTTLSGSMRRRMRKMKPSTSNPATDRMM